MMKGIDKKKHEHLIGCLEELSVLTTDVKVGQRIEEEMATLRETYKRYLAFICGIETQAERYHSLYNEVQRRIYKDLRSARRKQKNK